MLFDGFLGGERNRHDPPKAWKGGQPVTTKGGFKGSRFPGTGYGLGGGEGSAGCSGSGETESERGTFSLIFTFIVNSCPY